jgi:hypothetical protein
MAKQPVESYGPDASERLLGSFTRSGFKIRDLLVDIAVTDALNPPKKPSLTANASR